MPCLRADVSYFQCCNKGNRRRLHAGKSRTDPTAHDCSFKSKRWPQDQVQPGLSTRLQGSMLFEGRVRLYTGYRITSTTGIRAQMVTKEPAGLFHLLII